MSALARYFVANGKKVAGYDKTKTNITEALEELGIQVHFEDSVDNIGTPFVTHFIRNARRETTFADGRYVTQAHVAGTMSSGSCSRKPALPMSRYVPPLCCYPSYRELGLPSAVEVLTMAGFIVP